MRNESLLRSKCRPDWLLAWQISCQAWNVCQPWPWDIEVQEVCLRRLDMLNIAHLSPELDLHETSRIPSVCLQVVAGACSLSIDQKSSCFIGCTPCLARYPHTSTTFTVYNHCSTLATSPRYVHVMASCNLVSLKHQFTVNDQPLKFSGVRNLTESHVFNSSSFSGVRRLVRFESWVVMGWDKRLYMLGFKYGLWNSPLSI